MQLQLDNSLSILAKVIMTMLLQLYKGIY